MPGRNRPVGVFVFFLRERVFDWNLVGCGGSSFLDKEITGDRGVWFVGMGLVWGL
jgi:hypothetical protein